MALASRNAWISRATRRYWRPIRCPASNRRAEEGTNAWLQRLIRSVAARRAIGIWLLTLAAMVFAMVVLGGLTRLTNSGLSMVEWRPVTGWLPPLSEEAWQPTFAAYQAFPEYQKVNAGMTLAEPSRGSSGWSTSTGCGAGSSASPSPCPSWSSWRGAGLIAASPGPSPACSSWAACRALVGWLMVEERPDRPAGRQPVPARRPPRSGAGDLRLHPLGGPAAALRDRAAPRQRRRRSRRGPALALLVLILITASPAASSPASMPATPTTPSR